MEISQIKDLFVGNDKLEDLIEVILDFTKNAPIDGIHDDALAFKGELVGLNNDKENFLLTDADYKKHRKELRIKLLDFLNQAAGFLAKHAHFEAAFHDSLLDNGAKPFADRTEFRGIIKEALKANEPKIIFIKNDKSALQNTTNQKMKLGISYLEEYLLHLRRKDNSYRVVSFGIPQLEGTDAFKAVRLAEFMADELEMEIKKGADEQFKFNVFFRELSKRIKALADVDKQTVIFFFHDFHQIDPLPADLKNFIHDIAVELQDAFPKSFFIIAGLDYEQIPNWLGGLEFNSSVKPYNMEMVSRDNFKDCLRSTFKTFKDKIIKRNKGDLTEDEYVEGIFEHIIPSGDMYNLESAGLNMKRELSQLRNLVI